MLENYLGYLVKVKNLINDTGLTSINDITLDTKDRSLALSEGNLIGNIGDLFSMIGADVLSKNFKSVNFANKKPENIDYLEFCVYDKLETLDSVKSYYERLKNSLEVSSKNSGDVLKSINTDDGIVSNREVGGNENIGVISDEKKYTNEGVKLSSIKELDVTGNSLYARRYREINQDFEEDSEQEVNIDDILELLDEDDVDNTSPEEYGYDELSEEDLSELGLGDYSDEGVEQESEWLTDSDGYDELSEEDLADLGIGGYQDSEDIEDSESEDGDYDDLSEEDLSELGLSGYDSEEDSSEEPEDEQNDSGTSVWEDAFSDGDDNVDLESLDWGNDEGDSTDYSFLDNAWDKLYAKQHSNLSKKDLKGKDAADKLVDISNGLLDTIRRKINESQVS